MLDTHHQHVNRLGPRLRPHRVCKRWWTATQELSPRWVGLGGRDRRTIRFPRRYADTPRRNPVMCKVGEGMPRLMSATSTVQERAVKSCMFLPYRHRGTAARRLLGHYRQGKKINAGYK
jgi:hypothetical protein